MLHRFIFKLLPACLSFLAGCLACNSTQAADSTKTIGLVLTRWSPAFYETPGAKDECPAGFHSLNKENWSAQFPTEEQRAKFNQSYVHLGPLSPGGPIPEDYLQARGPQGSNIVYNPTLVKDPLPLKEVQSKVAYGLNLDGTEDGHATPNSCAHQKFVAPDGEPGVDNQLYRVLGCAPGWRKSGFMDGYHNGQFHEYSLNRILVEIRNVHDELNDDNVEVVLYKGLDRIVFDSGGKAIPWLTQRADTRFPQYITTTHGKIVDGVLLTDPIDARFPLFALSVEGDRLMRGMRLQLKLTDTGAVGQVAGYEDVAQWWNMYSKAWQEVVDSIGLWSPPAFYQDVVRLADGYPDQKTGQCTGISASYRIDAVRAFIIQPPPDDPILRRMPQETRQRGVTIAQGTGRPTEQAQR